MDDIFHIQHMFLLEMGDFGENKDPFPKVQGSFFVDKWWLCER